MTDEHCRRRIDAARGAVAGTVAVGSAGRAHVPPYVRGPLGAVSQPARFEAVSGIRGRVRDPAAPVQHRPRRVVRGRGGVRGDRGLVLVGHIHRAHPPSGTAPDTPPQRRPLVDRVGRGRPRPGVPHAHPPLRRPAPVEARLRRRTAARRRGRRARRSVRHRHRPSAHPPPLRRRGGRHPHHARGADRLRAKHAGRLSGRPSGL